MAALSLSATNNVSGSTLSVSGSPTANLARLTMQSTDAGGSIWIFGDGVAAASGTMALYNQTTSTVGWTISPTGDFKVNAGNIIQGTAAKGVNFTANTPAAGMTSQLLNWYEEGTWTPNQGGGLTVVGTFSSSGKYTRIGRQVTVAGQFNATTSVSAAASAICCTNLPFSSVTSGAGSMVNATVSASSTCLTSAANLYVATTMAATTVIYFSVTYFV